MTSRKNRIIGFSVLLAVVVLTVAYRYSSKRFEYYGHYDKVWAHRVNDLKKLESSETHFSGIELDLVYQKDGDFLDVNHPPAESKGLTFKTYTEAITTKNLKLWLDIKNLNQENQQAVLEKIDDAVVSAGLNTRAIIVESSQPELLPIFQPKGYRISYYLPSFRDLKTEAEITEQVQVIKEKTGKNLDLEVSTNFEDYDIISKYLPSRTKNFWVLNRSYSLRIFKNYGTLRKMLKDPTVKTVLTPYNNFNAYF